VIKIAWDDTQATGSEITSTEWNDMVTYIKTVISASSTIIGNSATISGTLVLDQNNNAVGIDIDTEATSSVGIQILADAMTSGQVYYGRADNAAFTGRVAQFRVGSSGVGVTGTGVYVENNGAGRGIDIVNTDTTGNSIGLYITQATNQSSIVLDHNNSSQVINIDQDANDTNACFGIRMNIANAGAGTEYAFRFDGSEIVSAAVGGSQDKKITISIAGTDYYIPCYTA